MRNTGTKDPHQDIKEEEDLLPDIRREGENLIEEQTLHTHPDQGRHPEIKLHNQTVQKEQRVTEVRSEEKEIKEKETEGREAEE